MLKNQNRNSRIEITDLIGDAVENAIAEREYTLTSQQTKYIQGGIRFPIISFCIYSGGEDGQLLFCIGLPPL